MPRSYRNGNGALFPVRITTPATGNGPDALFPLPQHSAAVPSPIDFTPLYPPDFYPAENLNLRHGGDAHWVNARRYPLPIPAGGVASTEIKTDPTFTQIVIAAIGTIRRTDAASPNARINDIRYLVDVKRRNMSLQDQVDGDWIPFNAVFGPGEYQHPFAMPMLLPANSTFLIECRNITQDIPLVVNMQFLVARLLTKEAESTGRY